MLPNPFNPETVISFELPEASDVRISVYNVRGELVRTLTDWSMTPGKHEIAWDSRDSRGRLAASGVYVYRFEVKEIKSGQEYNLNGKMTLMR